MTQAYNSRGRLESITSSEGTIRYEYDDIGQLVRTYTGMADPPHTSTSGDGKAITDARYAYDLLGRLATVALVERNDVPVGSPELTAYSYDALGNLDTVRLPNQVVSDYDYDELNRLTRLRHFEDANDNGVLDVGETLLGDYEYTLRSDGKRSRAVETNDQGDITTVDWLYDEMGRLVEERYDATGTVRLRSLATR